jgi:hypothetical protein
LEKYKWPGSAQILTELIQAGSEVLVSAIHKLINSIRNKKELPDQWKESIIVPIHKRMIAMIIVEYHIYQLHTKLYQISFSQVYVHTQKKLLQIAIVDFEIKDIY